MSLEAQRAMITDAEELLAAQKLAFQTEAELYDDYTIAPLLETVDELVEQFQTHVILKIVIDGVIAGSVRGHKRNGVCHIERLFVHPEHRGKGLSKRLMSAIEQEVVAARYQLYTGIRSERNIGLYESLGFQRYKSELVNATLGFVYMEKTRRDEAGE